MSTKLSLRIHRVKCVDETGGRFAERVGNDEIYLGGFVVGQDGSTTAINPVSIYPHFDDGDVKTFNPPKIFHTLTLPVGGAWPKGFGIGLVLVERDAGGMVDAVKKIADFAEAKIKEKLNGSATDVANARSVIANAMTEGNAERAAAAIPPLLLTAIQLAAPFILDYVKRVIIGAFADEIFTPQMATLELSSANFKWGGTTDSAEKTVRFRDHSGIYDLTYDWQLS